MKKENKNVGLTAFILYVLCAVIWSVRLVLEILDHSYRGSEFRIGMDVLCVGLWIVAAIVQYRRYRTEKEKKDE